MSRFEDPVVLTARRLAATRSRTLPRGDAQMEAERLRLDGWSVSIGPTQKTRATVIDSMTNCALSSNPKTPVTMPANELGMDTSEEGDLTTRPETA